MKHTIETILDDTASNKPQALIGLLDYLINDCNRDIIEIASLAERKFNVPFAVAYRTIELLTPKVHLTMQ